MIKIKTQKNEVIGWKAWAEFNGSYVKDNYGFAKVWYGLTQYGVIRRATRGAKIRLAWRARKAARAKVTGVREVK